MDTKCKFFTEISKSQAEAEEQAKLDKLEDAASAAESVVLGSRDTLRDAEKGAKRAEADWYKRPSPANAVALIDARRLVKKTREAWDAAVAFRAEQFGDKEGK